MGAAGGVAGGGAGGTSGTGAGSTAGGSLGAAATGGGSFVGGASCANAGWLDAKDAPKNDNTKLALQSTSGRRNGPPREWTTD